MFDVLPQISWIAVALATVASIAIGGLYFALLVPKAYLRALGRDDAQPAPQSLVAAVGPLVCMVVVVVTSAVLVAALGITATGDALAFGAIVGVGYLVAMTFQIAINPNFPHPLRYGLLNTPYFLLSSLVTSVLLVRV